MTRIVVIGATSGIATEFSRQWLASEPTDIVLVGRDFAALAALAADLRVRSDSSVVQTVTGDFFSPENINEIVGSLFKSGRVDVALIAHGTMPEQSALESNLALAWSTLEVNANSVALFAEAFVGNFLEQGDGRLAVIGSVAGDRARRSNYIYGAAKAFVASYVAGLQHRLVGTNVVVTLVKPGPTLTPMTAHLTARRSSMATPGQVAVDIIRGIRAGKAVVYTPGKWRLIMAVVRMIPNSIFNRLNF